MNVGELFVSLGIKGSEKTLGAIANTRQGLKDIASTSLETKAALVGVAYAVERLFASSGRVGTGLTNFAATTGVATKTLQEYQYAARQAGASNEEVEGTFKALQSTMLDIYTGKGLPADYGRLTQVLGSVDIASDIEKYMKNPELLMQKLNDYARKETNPVWRKRTLGSFGVSEGVQNAMVREKFRPEILKQAPTYNDKEIANLDRANIAWSNLGTKIEMAIGHFNALHGGQLVTDLSKIVTEVIKLAEAFERLAEKAELFKWLGKVFEGWTLIFQELTKAIDTLNGKSAPAGDSGVPVEVKTIGAAASNFVAPEGERKSSGDRATTSLLTGGAGESLLGILGDILIEAWKKSASTGAADPALKSLLDKQPADKSGAPLGVNWGFPGDFKNGAFAPKIANPGGNGNSTSNQNNTVNQTLNFQNPATNAPEVGSTTKKAVQDAFRQLSAIGQGS